ncbi:MAG: hypothetical protein AB9866_05560 [Syntrophobacteraceae bacterium]
MAQACEQNSKLLEIWLNPMHYGYVKCPRCGHYESLSGYWDEAGVCPECEGIGFVLDHELAIQASLFRRRHAG